MNIFAKFYLTTIFPKLSYRPLTPYIKTCTTNTTKSLKRNTIRKMIYDLNFTNISINHPSVTTFINCVYRFQENIIAYINILACYKTNIIETMLKM